MKSKLNPICIILGLFLFKVSVIDKIRKISYSPNRNLASETVQSNHLRPIR